MIEPHGDRYKTTKVLTYKDCTVPKGTPTDGISYKFRLLGIFINKFDPRFIKAVIFHDHLTDIGDWDRGNRYFEELLPVHWLSPLMVKGVKLYRKLFIRK